MKKGDTHFIEEFGEILKASCHQNEPPFCEVACPFHLPVREMEEKWLQGRAKAVYRTYQNAVAFPAIVSRICTRPCEKVCPMRERGGAISLIRLEQATIAQTKRRKPNAYNMPQKDKKIAVVGGGMAGLGCALRLCNKKYSVSIYEKDSVLGGSARDLMDYEEFDEEIRNQFSEEHPNLYLQSQIHSLDEILHEYDAILVATGEHGEDFGLQNNGKGAYASTIDGIFLAGQVCGSANPIEALAEGLRASAAIERWLKVGLMNEPFVESKTRLVLDPKRFPELPSVLPSQEGQVYTPEEVIQEAQRCRRCSCDICTKECDLMRIQEKTPNRLYEEAYITVRPSTLANDGRWATRRIASCDQCGLCKTVCPQDIDMGKFLLQSHRGLKDSNAMPWAFHDFWLRDFDSSANEAADVIFRKGVQQISYVYFPGCQYTASDPERVSQVTAWLMDKHPDSALWLNCCGAPAVWAVDDERQEQQFKDLRQTWEGLGKPVIILACPTCRKMFDRFLPESSKMFIEEALLQWGLPDIHKNCASEKLKKDRSEVTFSFFDPCAGRDYPELADAVRKLAEKLKIQTEELSYHGKTARCCSFGGQYSIAAPDYAKRVRMERAEESPNPYITSCINCRDAFASRGKENLHILDLVFGEQNRRRETPLVTQRRANRLELKREMRERYQDGTMEVRTCPVKMICSKELEKKLSDEYILLTDLEEVIAYCEENQVGVLDPEGCITGHRRLGYMTYWVKYQPQDDGSYRLITGYAHRMNIEGE